MTIDEAIQDCGKQILKYERQCEFGISSEGKEYNSQCAAYYKQLAEWLIELKDLKEENKVLISECDRLIKEKGELLNKVSGGDVLRICQLEEQLEKAKRLLKAAVEDFSFASENFISNMDSFCSMYNHMAGCVKDCPMNGLDDYGRCKWRYTDEALKLIGEERNES